MGVRPEGDIWVEGGSLEPTDRRGFTVAFQPSVISMAVKRSPGDWAAKPMVSKAILELRRVDGRDGSNLLSTDQDRSNALARGSE